MVSPTVPIELIAPLMVLHFLSGVGYLATRDYIIDNNKWADVPMIAIVFHTGFAFILAAPLIGDFAIWSNGAHASYGIMGFFYFLEGLIAFAYAGFTISYYLYLKLGWFQDMYSGRAGGRVRPMGARRF